MLGVWTLGARVQEFPKVWPVQLPVTITFQILKLLWLHIHILFREIKLTTTKIDFKKVGSPEREVVSL